MQSFAWCTSLSVTATACALQACFKWWLAFLMQGATNHVYSLCNEVSSLWSLSCCPNRVQLYLLHAPSFFGHYFKHCLLCSRTQIYWTWRGSQISSIYEKFDIKKIEDKRKLHGDFRPLLCHLLLDDLAAESFAFAKIGFSNDVLALLTWVKPPTIVGKIVSPSAAANHLALMSFTRTSKSQA